MKLLLAIAALLISAPAVAPVWAQSGNNLEIIHHPNYDKSVFMPFSPAIKIKSGKILWLAGGTALPVYHDHPHKREQVLQYLNNDLEAQVKLWWCLLVFLTNVPGYVALRIWVVLRRRRRAEGARA